MQPMFVPFHQIFYFVNFDGNVVIFTLTDVVAVTGMTQQVDYV